MKRLALIFVFSLALFAKLVQPADAGVNPRYFPGDWTAITSVRYVQAAVQTTPYLYFASRGGIAVYDRFDNRWLMPYTTAQGLRANNVRRLAYDVRADKLYADTPMGASVFEPLTDEWLDVVTFPDSLVQPWQRHDISRLTLPFGYSSLTSGYITDPEMRSYAIQGAVEDHLGDWWVGTWGLFVWVHEFGTFQLEPQTWGLFSEDVSAIYMDSTTMMFGGPDYYGNENGLSVYDTLTGEWQYFESRYTQGFASDNIYRMVGKPGGRYVWCATDQGVVRFDRTQSEFRTYDEHSGLSHDEIWGLYVDEEILWVGTDYGIDGIYLPSDSIFSATTDPLAGARVYDIDVIDDVVWLGTDRGLFRLVKPTPQWYRFGYGDGPLSGRVRALTHDDDYLYVGSDRGIAMIDRRGLKPVQVFESPSVLPDENIFDIAVTKDIVWAATRSGLLRFVPSTHESRLFTADDGMLDSFVETILVDGDYLWLGTQYGANRFRWNNPLRID
jgi:ligand-binding sensor domain-containing protein